MSDLITQAKDFLGTFTILNWLGIVLVVFFLAKKLIKWAVLFGLLVVVVLPYLDEQGYLDPIKSFLGL
jgi:ABC-type protease/lipase transport system fused ATPase/permease subunit